MPRQNTEIVHTAATDHRIVRRPDSAGARPKLSPSYRPGESLLNPFYAKLVAPDDPEASRDLGVALLQMAVGHHPPEQIQEALIVQALPRLEQALARAPDDVEAWEARGHARMLRGDETGALAAYERALGYAPRRELTLTLAGTAAEKLERDDSARDYWLRAQAVNPWRWQYPYHLARLAVKSRNAAEVLRYSREALRLNPAAIEAHMLEVWALLTARKKEEAERAFAALMALKPPQAEAMRRWFTERQQNPNAPP
jgi:tetratricopeptide (TPR) repeat protein